MKNEVRIIDGVLKVVEVVDGKIVKIVKDYKKPIIDKRKEIDQVKCKKDTNGHIGNIRIIEENELMKYERHNIRKKEVDEYNEKMRILEENEKIHEIHYGERYEYQMVTKINGPNDHRKRLLEYKAERGIIDKNIINIKNSKELLDDWAGKNGFYNYGDYLNTIAIGRGFTCYGEYEKIWSYYPGMPSPIKENRRDARFLGTYIAENGIAKIYEGSQRMAYYNRGYDILCPKGYKIDVKATVLNQYNIFNFTINKNKIADYFALVVFNNIIELVPIHMWIIKSDENIDGRIINKLTKLTIPNEPKHLSKYGKYEKLDKLDVLKNLCEKFDAENRLEIEDYNVMDKYTIMNIIVQIRSETCKNMSPIDILHMIKEKKKETIINRIPIIPAEEVIRSWRY
jgi:hypothetical protein